jgi:crotonobetainyl-CoA:carnitine CoA-transferase CaiB-like acyl-CoA transferase
MSRLGLGYEEVSRLNPGIVYCSISAFGSGEKGAAMPGYDFLVQAASGFMSITGEEDGTPMKTGVAIVDVICGLNATIGILAALEERRKTGKGQHVEVSLMDSALAGLVNQASGYLLADSVPGPRGNKHPSITPYETFRAADRPFVIAVGNEALWRRLCDSLGLENLVEDERFATNSGRVAHRDELGEILESVFVQEEAVTWVERLGEAGVPAGLINDVGEAFELAKKLDLDPVVELENREGASTIKLTRSPLRMSRTPVIADKPPPRLGEHSEEIREWLGRKDGEDAEDAG